MGAKWKFSDLSPASCSESLIFDPDHPHQPSKHFFTQCEQQPCLSCSFSSACLSCCPAVLFWHRARPKARVQPGDDTAADTSPTGPCISEEEDEAQTAVRTSSFWLSGQGLEFAKLSVCLSPLSEGFFLSLRFKSEVGMNLYCLHKSLNSLFDVHRVIYDHRGADTCTRLLSHPLTVLSLFHLQSSSEHK